MTPRPQPGPEALRRIHDDLSAALAPHGLRLLRCDWASHPDGSGKVAVTMTIDASEARKHL